MPVQGLVSAQLFLPIVVRGNLLFQLCGLSEEPSGFFDQALRRLAQLLRFATELFGITRRLGHLLKRLEATASRPPSERPTQGFGLREAKPPCRISFPEWLLFRSDQALDQAALSSRSDNDIR